MQNAITLFYALQLGHAANGNQIAQLAKLFGDPQAHIGGAGNQPRLRQLLAQTRQAGHAGRRIKLRLAIAVLPIFIAVQGLQSRYNRRCCQCLRRQIEHALTRIQNGPVARAAAQVAGQSIGQLLARRRGAALRLVLLINSPQRHGKTRRAKAALRAVALHQSLLHRVQVGAVVGRCWCRLANALEIFHREQSFALQIGQELDASVHRLQPQALHRLCIAGLRQLSHHHGASAAIAFVATFLAALALRIVTQPVQNSLRGRYLVHLGNAALVVEADGLVHGGH